MKRRAFVQMTALGAGMTLGTPRRQAAGAPPARRLARLDAGWRFLLGEAPGAEAPAFDAGAWQDVTLPHTAHLEPLVTGPAGSAEAQWQGICWYRRTLRVEPGASRTLIRFDGAMNVADVWLDGERVGGHLGGFLPFVIDLSDRVRPGRDHLLAVRLDNRDNAVTGPKPMAQLDFNTYGGLYRPVWLIGTDGLHISDPLLEDRPAGGGVFVTYPRVSRASASIRVQVHMRNDRAEAAGFRVRLTLREPRGAIVVAAASAPLTLTPGAGADVVQTLEVAEPRLWSPADPSLHTLDCEVVAGAVTVDAETLRVGIRRIAISRDGFSINGERLYLRGTNRHQEYPYLGYALPDAAQYRDARKIKEAGFDYVRLSHYPHAPAFMDACDELGLVVMDCIPGWQYFGPDPAFTELAYRNCRDLIRRDRNHPCVVLWEVSLNETGMPPAFIARTHAIAHEEYPGDQCFTAGWTHGYDVFIDARQHHGCRQETAGACLVSEYGDWEYYAMNAGLDQGTWQNLSPAESNSRQLRWQGERAMLQQAANFQEAHNDNRATIAFADGLWVMFDYNRGYAPDIESSGCMDIFRLPKYAYHFFRSQRDAGEWLAGAPLGPVVFIASDWTAASSPSVRVFSNCDEVALSLNGRLLERRGPDRDRMSSRLAHPPFTFATGGFVPGVLEAVGYLGGQRAARQAVRTPGAIVRLSLALDLSGRRRDPERRDALFCYAALRDAAGTVVSSAWENVAFGVTGGATLVGANPLATDAGIATILLQTAPGPAPAAVHALALVEAPGGAARLLTASLALEGAAPATLARRTAEGAELLVRGTAIAALDARAPKVRVPASAPPERRDPFRR